MFLCHFTRCRKETGTLHGANAFFREATLAHERGEERLSRITLEGTREKRWFWKKTCGSPMPRQDADELIVLPAGSLDDGSALTPDAHIFHESRAEWADRAAEASRHAEYMKRG